MQIFSVFWRFKEILGRSNDSIFDLLGPCFYVFNIFPNFLGVDFFSL
jgi:hypothetical protein